MKCSENFVGLLLRNGEQGPVCGISLGFAYVAEHETESVAYLGNQVDPRGLRLYEFPDTVYLTYLPGHFIPNCFERNPAELDEKELLRITGSWKRNLSFGVGNMPGIACAWADKSFSIGISQDNTEVVEFLRELYKAFCRGDGCIHLQRPSLSTPHWTLCIYVEPIEGVLPKDMSMITNR